MKIAVAAFTFTHDNRTVLGLPAWRQQLMDAADAQQVHIRALRTWRRYVAVSNAYIPIASLHCTMGSHTTFMFRGCKTFILGVEHLHFSWFWGPRVRYICLHLSTIKNGTQHETRKDL